MGTQKAGREAGLVVAVRGAGRFGELGRFVCKRRGTLTAWYHWWEPVLGFHGALGGHDFEDLVTGKPKDADTQETSYPNSEIRETHRARREFVFPFKDLGKGRE